MLGATLLRKLSLVMIVAPLLVGCIAREAPVQPATQGKQVSPAVAITKPAPSQTVKPATEEPRPAAGPTTAAKPEEKARYGGVVTRVLNRDVPNFDIHQGQGADVSQTLANMYEGLARLHPIEHGKIVPELAESWELSPDGKVYTFKFAGGIKWHDGKPFTMDDVKYNLERMQNPKAFNTISPRGQGLLQAMESTQIASEDTIKLATKYPSASFLPGIASGWVAIGPKHILVEKGDMKREAIGTGPFKLKEFSPDVSLELVGQVPMVIVFWDVWHTGAWKEVKNFRPGPGIHPWGKYDQTWLSK